ncbi:hypothetical protein [Streptomyces capitiformicae]|uniref:Uncharacterized protein n=1 Tax=Streptomyces capitiformicae TaxID=2014920 RepID=A0A919DI19_9ACTN|nr:hypothetical protein [Streptomyces capitiformicae]GHE44577.1 hypothetical protein GCM10017771_64750 [Streptomyces capitiformicae]
MGRLPSVPTDTACARVLLLVAVNTRPFSTTVATRTGGVPVAARAAVPAPATARAPRPGRGQERPPLRRAARGPCKGAVEDI